MSYIKLYELNACFSTGNSTHAATYIGFKHTEPLVFIFKALHSLSLPDQTFLMSYWGLLWLWPVAAHEQVFWPVAVLSAHLRGFHKSSPTLPLILRGAPINVHKAITLPFFISFPNTLFHRGPYLRFDMGEAIGMLKPLPIPLVPPTLLAPYALASWSTHCLVLWKAHGKHCRAGTICTEPDTKQHHPGCHCHKNNVEKKRS